MRADCRAGRRTAEQDELDAAVQRRIARGAARFDVLVTAIDRRAGSDAGIILKAAGMSYDDVVAVQVYLTDVSLFARMNAVYSAVFKDPRPTRTTVGVNKLAAAGARIEITMTARK